MGWQTLNEDTGETLVKDTVSGAQSGKSGEGRSQAVEWVSKAKAERERNREEGNGDDKSTKKIVAC